MFLVTGSNGFLGSNFIATCNIDNAKLLKLDMNNTALDDKDPHFICCDIRNKKRLEMVFNDYHVSTVVHTAALKLIDKSFDQPDVYFETNVIGTKNLLDLSIQYNVKKFVNISSYTIYGECPKNGYTEHTECKPINPYSITKLLADQMVVGYANTYGIDACNLRLHALYGMGYSLSGEPTINKFIKKIRYNESLTVYNNGEQLLDFLHVKDACRAIVVAMRHKNTKGMSFNIGSGNVNKLINIIHMIGDAMEKPVTINFTPVSDQGRVGDAYTSSKLAYDYLNYQPVFKDIRYGIEDVFSKMYS